MRHIEFSSSLVVHRALSGMQEDVKPRRWRKLHKFRRKYLFKDAYKEHNMCIQHCDNISATGRYLFHPSLRKSSHGKTEHWHVTAYQDLHGNTLMCHITRPSSKQRHICCAHLRPHGSTLHVAAHLGPHGSTLHTSRHACNPTPAQHVVGRSGLGTCRKRRHVPLHRLRNTAVGRLNFKPTDSLQF
jgi:hypothetical protein